MDRRDTIGRLGEMNIHAGHMDVVVFVNNEGCFIVASFFCYLVKFFNNWHQLWNDFF